MRSFTSIGLRNFRSPALLRPALLLLAVAFVGCRGEVPEAETRRIVILTNGSSPYWNAAELGAMKAADDLNLADSGLSVTIDSSLYKVEAQLDKLRRYAGATDIVAVAISVTDAQNGAIPAELRKLQEAGIKVITIDSDVNRTRARDARFAYMGTENIDAGRELGKAARGLKPDGAKYATFVGVKGAANAIDRIGGFAESAGETFVSIQSLADGGQIENAKENVRTSLDQHSEIDMLVGIWSYNTPAIVGMVNELNVRSRVTIIGFDADPPTIRGMGEGSVDAIVVQNPFQMGYQGVRLMKALVEDDQATIKKMLPNMGDENGDLYDTGLKVVVPNEQSPLKKEMFDSKTEFFTLDAFKAWLKERGLTGS